ncbi:SpoIIE family protein phosphatase [candidate division GN15 bacterium]|nr:SpoIIE family protein phosphatase [candidate division GN15 bacterium]
MQIELIHTLFFFLAGGFLVFLAITITRDNFANRVNRAAGLLLFFAGLGPLILALGYVLSDGTVTSLRYTNTTIYHLAYLWELFFPALLVFSWLFPVDRMRSFRFPRLRYLVVVPQLLHVLLMLFYDRIVDLLNMLVASAESEGLLGALMQPLAWLGSQFLLFLGTIYTNEAIIFGAVNLSYVLLAVYFFETGRRYLTNPRLLSQTRIVIWGARFGLGLLVIAYAIDTLTQTPVAELVSASVMAGAVATGGGGFAYAIIRHQFLNLQLVLRQSLIYTLSSAVLVGLYVVIGMRSTDILEPLFGDRAEVVSYVFILLLLLIFQPISQWLDNIIRSMFVRTRTDHRNIIERFSRQVITIFDPKQLRQTIEETLKTSMLVDQVYFVLYDDSVSEYAVLPSDDYRRRTVIDREDLMLRGINLLDTPTRFASLSDYMVGSKLAEILSDLQVRIILPMKDAQHLLGFLALTTRAAGYRYSAEDINLLGVLSNQMVSALTNARLYADSLERLRLEEEVNMARQIQLDLLPSKPPDLVCSRIAASSTPSRVVGGDFYDFVPLPDQKRTGIVIADASGKGMPAALMIAQIQAIIRTEIGNGTPVPQMMKNMNTQMALGTSSEKYVTLFYAVLDEATKEIEYANAGHNHPFIVRRDGSVEYLDVGGPIIGAFPYIEYESARVTLEDDDVFFLFTDGLSEAMDADGHEYGEERIRNFVVERRVMTAEEILSSMLDDVYEYDPTNPPQDDTTAIAIKMTNHEERKDRSNDDDQ